MFAIIMAGGSGTRFWPASRQHLPKQFLNITSDKTMLEETVNRILPFIVEENIYTVVGKHHAELTHKILGETKSHVIVEPVGRNTAPCIGLAALYTRRQDENAPMFVLPADHFIADTEAFINTLKAASEVAKTGAIVTLGIAPTRPETGYGYIEINLECGDLPPLSSLEQTSASDEEKRRLVAALQNCFRVNRFVEKPDAETALKYMTGGRHLWNSGIFVFTAKTILEEIEKCLPSLSKGLQEIDKAIGTSEEQDVINRVYNEIESISIDYGVMEKTLAPIYVFKSDFGWSDVGSWQALYELRESEYDVDKNLLLGNVETVDAKNNLVYSNTNRTIALLGVEGLVITDTEDALLIADIKRSQEVKKFSQT
jgi:mannose-1-phosphate guanylyltransferase